MKRYIIAPLLILVLSVAVSSCKDRDLRHNALGYTQAMADYNVDAAYPYATSETQNTTLPYIKSLLTVLDTNYIASNTPATISIDSVVHHSDTSATVYFHKDTPIQKHANATIDMRLRNDQWLAHQIIQPAQTIDSTRFEHSQPEMQYKAKDIKKMKKAAVKKDKMPTSEPK